VTREARVRNPDERSDIRVHPAYRCAHAGYSFAVAMMLSPTPGFIRIDSGELLLTRDPSRA
jgi:hypothetical protein